ncbi:hypothetical protein B0H16DRAFT_369907 [Mycena metata]|uniref:Uncharacterized protein n=1 Tax=Mycena metata TaxID=1033252 RepID=A0AAD7NMF2_9AGAR|nr:hypothetical protein B0H16DRAFT_369907 [Mycena metata]
MAFAAAANVSSHASTSALTVAKREITPAASPFAQLLRNSRFAQFDPQIRKTYYSPKQFVERGYWGLKRPISQRKRNSFITIKQWEARQHYIEWDNAEDQIRFIRRMKEVDVRPVIAPRSSWGQQLGTAKDTWLVDSEFAPHDWGNSPKRETKEVDIPLDSLGKRGSGEYGARAPPYTPPTHQTQKATPAVIPNVMSMSPGEFKHYLQKLRALRPAFMTYLDREAKEQEELRKYQEEQRAKGIPMRDPRPTLAGLTLAQLSQFSDGPYHRVFLAEHTLSEYNSTRKIQPQPHRNGALTYTHPTTLDPLFRLKPKPGIILTEASHNGRWAATGDNFLVAFAGVVATLRTPSEEYLLPLFDPDVQRENWVHAVTEMRPARKDPLHLLAVPRVVGATPDEGLSGVKIALQLTTWPGYDGPQRLNPFFPGSRPYLALVGTDNPRPAARAAAATAAASMPQGPPPIRTLATPPGSPTSGFQPQLHSYDLPQTRAEQEKNRNTLGLLQNLLRQGGGPVTDGEL